MVELHSQAPTSTLQISGDKSFYWLTTVAGFVAFIGGLSAFYSGWYKGFYENALLVVACIASLFITPIALYAALRLPTIRFTLNENSFHDKWRFLNATQWIFIDVKHHEFKGIKFVSLNYHPDAFKNNEKAFGISDPKMSSSYSRVHFRRSKDWTVFSEFVLLVVSKSQTLEGHQKNPSISQ